MKNKMFQACIFVTFIAIITNIFSTWMIANYRVVPLGLDWFVTILYYIFTPMMGLFYFYYSAAVLFDNNKRLFRRLLFCSIPGIAYTLLVLSNIFNKKLFDLTLTGGYVQGEWRFITYVIFYVYCLGSVVLVLLAKKRVERQMSGILISFPLIAGLVIVVQLMFPDILLSGSAATAAILIIYLHLQNKQISVDYLTKIPNRQELVSMLGFLISKPEEVDFALVIVSLRRFKNINDTYGHANGDALLKEISKYLKGMVGTKKLYRFGGDEFAVLFPGATEASAEEFVLKIDARMSQPWEVKDFVFTTPYAIGLTHYPTTAKTVEGIINGVEYAVAKAKQQKKVNVCYCDNAMLGEINRKNTVFNILREKMQDNSFELYYQPIYSVKKDKFSFAESLMRINNSELGSISPGEFIPIAEESGLIIELTYLILDKVCAFIKKLLDQGIAVDAVHVNFSAMQFAQENLMERIVEIIEKYQIPYSTLKVEFTETAIAENAQQVIEYATTMRDKGIRLGLDDFGMGYSNIDSVTKIPFGSVKIDKSMVWAAVRYEKSAVMLKNMSKAFQELGAKVVAEGVETEEEDAFVKSCGIDMIQGYLYAKPMPEQEAEKFMREHG